MSVCHNNSPPRPLVALVSFGQLSTNKICDALNRLRVDYRVVLPGEIPAFEPTHIILSGSPKHVYNEDRHPLPEWVIRSPRPVLGICYGMQLIAYTFGGTVIRMSKREKGPVNVTEITPGAHPRQVTNSRWMNRYDQVVSVPCSFDITAVTQNNHIAAFTDHVKWWGVQYHPEAPKHGDLRLIKNFLIR